MSWWLARSGPMNRIPFNTFIAVAVLGMTCDVIAESAAAVTQYADLIRPDANSSDAFGECTVTDGMRIAVGVPRRNEVLVFNAVSGARLGTISADTAEVHENALFGAALAFSGDTLIVGAPQDNEENGSRPGGDLAEGSVFFYDLGMLTADTNLPAFREIKPGDQEGSDPNGLWFGYALAANETHVVVGAPNFNAVFGGPHTGAAFLYRVDTGAFERSFHPDDADAGDDRSGTCVAIGSDHIVIGCPGYDLPGDGRPPSNVGRVLVYRIADGSLVRAWVNPEPASRDAFGEDLAFAGTKVIVGAPGKDDADSGEDVGAAFTYDIDSDENLSIFTPSGMDEEHKDANVGTSVAILGDTGYAAAPGWEGDGITNGGTIFAIDLNSGECTGRYRIDPSVRGAYLGGDNSNTISTNFGQDLPIGGKLAAGGTVLAAGAPKVTLGSRSDAGAAYLFSLTETVSEVFHITKIELDRANVHLHWASSSAGTFDIESSMDLKNWAPVNRHTDLSLAVGPQTRQLNGLGPKRDQRRAFFRLKRVDP